ncbi:MAG: DEAD/DEAH box helicase, partial [Acidimicrobiales bacterium]|nr:DEAD/DEAH box helicase [Acidimicrobiales bacterium]
PLSGVEADGWLGELLAGAIDRRVEAMPTPSGFAGALRPYQERGLAWLSFLGSLSLGSCLADDMGLGKTAQLLALEVAERSEGRRPPPTLVVCPMTVVGNWQHEAARFAPRLRVLVHHGPDRLGGKAFARAAARADLVITTYGLVARDVERLSSLEWSRVVLDEAQNVKNSETRQAKAVRRLSSRHRVALTGTPVENRLSELWSIMEFLNPGLLGSERGFRERFAAPIERYGDDEAAGVLRRCTGPFVLRRLKTDRSIIADLPEKLEIKVYCNLTKEQASLYQAVVDDMLTRIAEAEGMERRALVLTTMLKLKQVCNHPVHLLGDGSSADGRSGKLSRLIEILEEAASEGDRALVFTQFAEMGKLLHAHLQSRLGREVLWLHGATLKRARDEMVARFQQEGGPAIFVLSLKAGGTGLNLTAANHVVHFDRWWNPAVEDQATDRAFRIGQRRDVQVRKLICAGTLEERIDELIERKRGLAERIVGSGEGWLTELSTEELRQVVALSADAVAEG